MSQLEIVDTTDVYPPSQHGSDNTTALDHGSSPHTRSANAQNLINPMPKEETAIASCQAMSQINRNYPSDAPDNCLSSEPEIRGGPVLQCDTPRGNLSKATKASKPAMTPGTTWIASYDRQSWPVVLCSCFTAPQDFLENRPTDSFPAILLGKRMFIWVRFSRLKAYDPHKRYVDDLVNFSPFDDGNRDDRANRALKKRYRAFKEDAPKFKDDFFWCNFIQRKQGLITARPKHTEDLSDKISQKRTLQRTIENGDNGGMKRRCNSGSMPGNGKIDVGYDCGNVEIQPALITNASSALAANVNPLQNEFSAPTKWSNTHISISSNPSLSPEELYGDIECTVFVGPNREDYQVRMADIMKSPFMSQLHEKYGQEHFVDLSLQADVSERDFALVFLLYDKGVLNQDIVLNKSGRSHVVEVIGISEMVEHLGQIFITAAKLQLDSLQCLIVEEIENMYPLPPRALLKLAEISSSVPRWGCEAESRLQRLTEDHITDYFWNLAEKQGRGLLSILTSNHCLRQAVFTKLSSSGTAGQLEFED